MESLKVLDIRGCEKITDLTPLEDLPNITMITIAKSGVQNIPEKLAPLISEAKKPNLRRAALRKRPVVKAEKPPPIAGVTTQQWQELLQLLKAEDLDTALAAADLMPQISALSQDIPRSRQSMQTRAVHFLKE